MNYHGADRTPEGNGIAQSRDGERGGHPCIEAVADDAVGVDVLDGTAVKLPFVGLDSSDRRNGLIMRCSVEH